VWCEIEFLERRPNKRQLWNRVVVVRVVPVKDECCSLKRTAAQATRAMML